VVLYPKHLLDIEGNYQTIKKNFLHDLVTYFQGHVIKMAAAPKKTSFFGRIKSSRLHKQNYTLTKQLYIVEYVVFSWKAWHMPPKWEVLCGCMEDKV
jgi:hypothetical protein